MNTKPKDQLIRVELRLPVDVAYFLAEEANMRTKKLGGAVRKGGKGIVTTSHVITDMVNKMKRKAGR